MMMNCPICGTELNSEVSHVDSYIEIERILECPEKHYRYEWNAGYTQVYVRSYSWEWGDSIREELLKVILGDIAVKTEQAKKSWNRMIQEMKDE